MPAQPTPSADDATLLVVDDNEMNRDMLGRRLEKKGYIRYQEDGVRYVYSATTSHTGGPCSASFTGAQPATL